MNKYSHFFLFAFSYLSMTSYIRGAEDGLELAAPPLSLLQPQVEVTASAQHFRKMEIIWVEFIRILSSEYKDHYSSRLEHKLQVVSYLRDIETALEKGGLVNHERFGAVVQNLTDTLKDSITIETEEERIRKDALQKKLKALAKEYNSLTEYHDLINWWRSEAKRKVSEKFSTEHSEFRELVKEWVIQLFNHIFDKCVPEVSNAQVRDITEQEQYFEILEQAIKRCFNSPTDPLVNLLALYYQGIEVEQFLHSCGNTRELTYRTSRLKSNLDASDSLEQKIEQYINSVPPISFPPEDSFSEAFQQQLDTYRKKFVRVRELLSCRKNDTSGYAASKVLIDEEESCPTPRSGRSQESSLVTRRTKKTGRSKKSLRYSPEFGEESEKDSSAGVDSEIEIQKPIHHPHDKFVKRTLQVIPIAIDFFQQILPQHVLECINLSTLKLMDTTFIDDDMEKRIANTAFTVKLSLEEKYLYLLVKHLSSQDDSLLDKLHGYQGQVLKHRHNLDKKEKEKYLARVLTVILYTGKGKLSNTSNLHLMDSFRPGGVDSSIYILDLREETEETLKKKFTVFRPAALALKMVRNNLIPNEIPRESFEQLRQYKSYMHMLSTYIICAQSSKEKDEFKEVLSKMLEYDDTIVDEEDNSLKQLEQTTINRTHKQIANRLKESGMSPPSIAEILKVSVAEVLAYLDSSDLRKDKKSIELRMIGSFVQPISQPSLVLILKNTNNVA